MVFAIFLLALVLAASFAKRAIEQREEEQQAEAEQFAVEAEEYSDWKWPARKAGPVGRVRL